MIELGAVRVISGVSAFTGEPFCLVEVRDAEGEVFATGQLTPDLARQMALEWLGAAEAADYDSIVFCSLRDRGMGDVEAATFLQMLRDAREARDQDDT